MLEIMNFLIVDPSPLPIFIPLRPLYSYIKKENQSKGILEQDPGGEYLGLRGMQMGSGEGCTMRNFIVCTVYLYSQVDEV